MKPTNQMTVLVLNILILASAAMIGSPTTIWAQKSGMQSFTPAGLEKEFEVQTITDKNEKTTRVEIKIRAGESIKSAKKKILKESAKQERIEKQKFESYYSTNQREVERREKVKQTLLQLETFAAECSRSGPHNSLKTSPDAKYVCTRTPLAGLQQTSSSSSPKGGATQLVPKTERLNEWKIVADFMK